MVPLPPGAGKGQETMSDAYERGGFGECLDTAWSARCTWLPAADHRRCLLSTGRWRLHGDGFRPHSTCVTSSGGRIRDASGHQPPGAKPRQR